MQHKLLFSTPTEKTVIATLQLQITFPTPPSWRGASSQACPGDVHSQSWLPVRAWLPGSRRGHNTASPPRWWLPWPLPPGLGCAGTCFGGCGFCFAVPALWLRNSHPLQDWEAENSFDFVVLWGIDGKQRCLSFLMLFSSLILIHTGQTACICHGIWMFLNVSGCVLVYTKLSTRHLCD